MLTALQFKFYMMAFWARLIDFAYDDIHKTNVHKHTRSNTKLRVINLRNLLKSFIIIPHTCLMWILYSHTLCTPYSSANSFTSIMYWYVKSWTTAPSPFILSALAHLLHRSNAHTRVREHSENVNAIEQAKYWFGFKSGMKIHHSNFMVLENFA